MEQFALVVHVIVGTLWVGTIFANIFIVWPTLRGTYARQEFPLEFVVLQGRRIAPLVYFAIPSMLVSGLALAFLRPPATTTAWVLLAAKTTALLIMASNIIYGTLVTWPKLQFSTSEETWPLWRGYGIRGFVTLSCGMAAALMGAFLH